MAEVFDHPEPTLETTNPEYQLGKMRVKNTTGVTRPALEWRRRFQHIKDASLELMEAGEPTQYLALGRETNTNSSNYGQWMRSYFIKNKDRVMVPGVWSLRSRKYFNETGEFVASEIQVRFLSENPEDETAIMIVSGMMGRPKKQPRELLDN